VKSKAAYRETLLGEFFEKGIVVVESCCGGGDTAGESSENGLVFNGVRRVRFPLHVRREWHFTQYI
jgi:hypothetical protein